MCTEFKTVPKKDHWILTLVGPCAQIFQMLQIQFTLLSTYNILRLNYVHRQGWKKAIVISIGRNARTTSHKEQHKYLHCIYHIGLLDRLETERWQMITQVKMKVNPTIYPPLATKIYVAQFFICLWQTSSTNFFLLDRLTNFSLSVSFSIFV